MTWISPSDHTDAALVHDPAVSLDRPYQLNTTLTVCEEAYDDSYADDGVEVRKVPCHIVL